MPDDSIDDSTIDLKKRARRRLVGAVVLALLAVIVLPFVMDSEPKPTGQEIQIRIPSQDSDTFVANSISAQPAALPAQPVPPVDETPVSNVADVVEKPASPPLRSAVTDAKSEAAIRAEVAHAKAALEGKDSEQWVVQLGAYQNTANVQQLTAKLKEMGLPSYTEKIELPQGGRTRVRAGPFNSREVADRARMRIKNIGVDGSVAQK